MPSKMASTLCQKWFKKKIFLSKSSKFHVFWTIQFCSNFTRMWYKHFLRNVWRDFRLPISVLATKAWKSFNGKSTAKNDFLIGYFMLPLLMLTLEGQKSLHTLFEKYLDHMLVKFEQNHMVRTNSYDPNFTKFWAFWQKVVNHFWQSVDAILEDVSVTETIEELVSKTSYIHFIDFEITPTDWIKKKTIRNKSKCILFGLKRIEVV